MKKGDKGYIFLKIIKKERKAIKFIIITAWSSDNRVTISNKQNTWCSV